MLQDQERRISVSRPRLRSRGPQDCFQHSLAMLNYRQTAVTYSECIYSVTARSIAKRSSQVAKKLFSWHTAGILHKFICIWYSTHKRHVG